MTNKKNTDLGKTGIAAIVIVIIVAIFWYLLLATAIIVGIILAWKNFG